MTVFVAHAPADCSAADGLEKVIERRGHFVELDDGHIALKPIERADVLVLLASEAFLTTTARLRLEQRALDAWAEGRLIVVKLDAGAAPVGLRDLPAVDAADAGQREARWNDVADAISAMLVGAAAARPLRKRAVFGAIALPLLAFPGVLALAASVSIWLVNRIGPTPGGWPELRAGIDQFGVRYGAPAGLSEWLFVLAIAVTVVILAAAIVRPLLRKSPRPEAPEQAAPKQSGATFVSYAAANAAEVLPVIEAAKRAGRKFCLDQNAAAAETWVGESARAVRGSAGVVVMCSKAAFESDQVKREVYLADRYKKRLAPVFIEAAEPPEDFEYFFAGAQRLRLFETPEAERPQALIRALGAQS